MKKYYLTLDLRNDPGLIAEYERWHNEENFWPEIKQSIFDTGIIGMEIYRVHDRLLMIIDTDATFDFDRESKLNAGNKKVQEWEKLMWRFQRSLPWAKEGEKWFVMDNIFHIRKVCTS